jgi:phosphoglycerate-specific signal transduction histidine kinase
MVKYLLEVGVRFLKWIDDHTTGKVVAWFFPQEVPRSEELEQEIERLLAELARTREAALSALDRERQETISQINDLSRQIGVLDQWLARAEERAEALYRLRDLA